MYYFTMSDNVVHLVHVDDQSKGPNMLPCGTPADTDNELDNVLFSEDDLKGMIRTSLTTYCLDQLISIYAIRYCGQLCERLAQIQKTEAAIRPLSALSRMESVKNASAVLVDNLGLKPN